MAEFAYNNHYHLSIGASPFFANYGYHLVYTNQTLPAQVLEMPEHLQAIHKVQAKCQLALDLAQKAQKQYADQCQGPKQDINVGDHMWLEAINLSTDTPSKKPGAKQIRPFEVTEKLSEMTFHVNIPAQWHIHNVFHSHLLSKTKTDTIPGQVPNAPTPVMVHGKEQRVIECFIHSQWFWNHFQLKIWWEGYGEEHNEWCDYEAIEHKAADEEDIDLVQDYYQCHPNAPCHNDPPHHRQPPPQH
jgi:hypothetical protein